MTAGAYRVGTAVGRQIKRPALEAVSPPFFDLCVGHSAKVLAAGSDRDVFWVKVLDIHDDAMLGIVTSCDSSAPSPAPGLRLHDVIEFQTRHVFGVY